MSAELDSVKTVGDRVLKMGFLERFVIGNRLRNAVLALLVKWDREDGNGTN